MALVIVLGFLYSRVEDCLTIFIRFLQITRFFLFHIFVVEFSKLADNLYIYTHTHTCMHVMTSVDIDMYMNVIAHPLILDSTKQ